MNSNVCLVTFIFLSLENVADCCFSDKLVDKHDLEGTQKFNCISPQSYHQWVQRYQSGKAIGNIPPQTVDHTRFIIEVEDFDNNTEIFCKNSKKNTTQWSDPVLTFVRFVIVDPVRSVFNIDSKKPESVELFRTLIRIEANETCKENEEPTILEYNEKQNVSFSCLEHINKTKYIHLGQINTTSNMIQTYEKNSTHEIFNITQNGTILCCLYYVVNETVEEKWITRIVENKTLLFYNDISRQDALGSNENHNNSTSAADLNADPGYQTFIIIITTAGAIVFIMLVIIVICRTRCRKKPELETKVLYADLDFLHQIAPERFPRPSPEEESPYAQIIGELRPNTK